MRLRKVLSVRSSRLNCRVFHLRDIRRKERRRHGGGADAPVSGPDRRRAAAGRLHPVNRWRRTTHPGSSNTRALLLQRVLFVSQRFRAGGNHIQETESRTVPYRASVKVDKQRYATKLHRKREDAVADSNYARDTGKETLTFEMRNGRWYRAGSLFVAEKTEEYINGEWVPAKEEVERTVAAEDEQAGSWWQRAWESVTGRPPHKDEAPPPAAKPKPKPNQMQIGPSGASKRHQ